MQSAVHPVTVYRLFREGQQVVDEHGMPRDYASLQEAWNAVPTAGAPMHAELVAMPAEEMTRRAGLSRGAE
jgi:hypothetical protein